MQRTPLRISSLVAAALAALLAASRASAQQQIEVKADQTTTVSGSFPSLQSLVEDLCWRAGVTLLSYDAPDRPIAGRYQNVPLHEVLRRLLRMESFSVGLEGSGEARQPHVTWLRVIGEYEQASANRTKPQVSAVEGAGEFRVPPALMLTAFNTPAGPEQEAALRQLAGRVAGDPEELRKFLAVEPAVIAAEVGRYPQGVALITRLRDEQSDPAVRAHLDAVLALLGQGK